jgi:hypothetical protein
MIKNKYLSYVMALKNTLINKHVRDVIKKKKKKGGGGGGGG